MLVAKASCDALGLGVERLLKRHGQALSGLAALLLCVAGCDRVAVDRDQEEAPSVVPSERSWTAMPAGALRQTLEINLRGEDAGGEKLAEALEGLPASELWSIIYWLPAADGDEGRRVGLAAVVLSELVEKSPAEVARYLTTEGVPFGLADSSMSLVAFRRAMTHWASSQPEKAFEALDAYAESSIIEERIVELEDLHGERLEVTLAGAMPVSDLGAVTAQWDRLERREAASLLPRLLERLPSTEDRESLMDRTAAWLGEQWSHEGPGVVVEWALGLPDDELEQAIIDRVKEPKRDEEVISPREAQAPALRR